MVNTCLSWTSLNPKGAASRLPGSKNRLQTDIAQREPERLRFLHWDVQDWRPDPERRSPSGSNDTSLDPPGPSLRELGRLRDVSNLGPDPGRRYVQEPIPPITSVPSLLSREIGDKNPRRLPSKAKFRKTLRPGSHPTTC